MNEIEQKFFETFEIEQKKTCYYWDCPHSTGNVVDDLSHCKTCENPISTSYPEITDRILLDIAKVSVDWTGSLLIVDKNIKNEILEEAIFIAHRKDTDEFVRQIQALFKETE